MFKLNILPSWVKPVAVAVTVTAVLAGLLWYRAALIQRGRDEVRAKWQLSIKQAQDAQAKANTTATAETVKIIEVEKLVYRDRIQKVKSYVPTPATSCPVDADFKRMFNVASPARSASAEQ